MLISVKVKPKLVRAPTKHSLLNLIVGAHGNSFSTNYSANTPLYGSGKGKVVRVYNLHKINAKHRQIKYMHSNAKTGAVKGRTRKTELVRKGEWIAYVYDIDIALLKVAGLQVRQHNRNFTITKI